MRLLNAQSFGHMCLLSSRLVLTEAMCGTINVQSMGVGESIYLQPNTIYQLMSVSKGRSSVVQSSGRSFMHTHGGGLEAMAEHVKHRACYNSIDQSIRNLLHPSVATKHDAINVAIEKQFPKEAMLALLQLPAPIAPKSRVELQNTVVVTQRAQALIDVIRCMMESEGMNYVDTKEYDKLVAKYVDVVSVDRWRRTIDVDLNMMSMFNV